MNQSISPRSSFPSGNCSLLILVFVLPVLIFSCQPTTQKTAAEKAFMLDTLINGNRLIVKDTTQYASGFIRQLKESATVNESLKLVGDSLWVASKIYNSQRDTVVSSVDLIPTVLKLNELYRFSSFDQLRNFVLTLKRTNYTDLEYNLELDGKTIQAGIAMLQSTFFLAKEVFPGENGGDAMLFDQYIDGGAHWAAIKVETTEGKTVSFSTDDAEVKKLGEIPMLTRN